MKEKEEAQSLLAPHEPPVVTSLEIQQRIEKVEKIMTRLSKKKPPKPKPENLTITINHTLNDSDLEV